MSSARLTGQVATPATLATSFLIGPYRAYTLSGFGVANVANVANPCAGWPGSGSRKTAQCAGVGDCTSRRPPPVTSRAAFSGRRRTETARNIPWQVPRCIKSMRYGVDQRIHNPLGRFTPEMH